MLNRIINSLEEGIICILLAAMTLEVFIEVVMRYGFGTGVMWGEELTLHLSAWMVLFGVSYGLKVGSHIGVDALVKILPPLARKIVGGVAICACLFYCALFIEGAWVYLHKVYSIGLELDDMPIPKWIAHSILLIGMVMIAWRLLQLLWGIFTGKNEGFVLTDEAKESMRLAKETAQAAGTGGESK
ncbi:TRAP transporter small permease [Geothermobacter hydrogeniphilus]|uniref:C4-dicarboxylate ABC transporter permease n=1 Tax=Geothermobacter hydrogeniphilus TaxID=1969733 RepID=A0A1X0YCU3_9BACT|nr:TRAP transporter small permease [Geothermobacter hydrogeniphilus]ORJ63031.1 C4-dicarboxylate ABC transporter permease [Geothermobacter hydrogeniphilus]